MRVVSRLCTGLTIALVSLCSIHAAPPSPDVIRESAKSVLRIEARGCPGNSSSRQGTGFLWPDRSQVVTALHVVADCSDIVVQLLEPQVKRRASVQKILKKADLALLKVSDSLPGDANALPLAASEPRAQEDLATISMPLNTPTWQDTYGKRSVSVNRLSQLLDDSIRQRLLRQGTPDINLEIFRMDAVVKPGSSGGPVINAAGQVVGVIDGGLDGGSSALNWATHARFLNQLMASSESVQGIQLGAAIEETFAYSVGQDVLVDGVGEDFVCGSQSVFLLAQRTLEEVLDSLEDPNHLDDPYAFVQLLSNFAQYMTEDELESIAFNLYVNQNSGATIAVPANFALESADGGACFADAPDSDVGVLFSMEDLNYPAQAQEASLIFETAVGQILGAQYCQPDPMWSQAVPNQRWDGLISRRGGIMCASGGMPQYYIFSAHLARELSYTGMIAVHEEFEAFVVNNRVAMRDWVAASIATVISTYQL